MLLAGVIPARAAVDDALAALCADRAAVERVYYRHRLGEKPPFEQVSPPSLLERLVKEDLHKAAVLERVYHAQITPEQLEAEVRRINSTTRAPETLAELKAALGNEPARFARTVVKPMLVDRLLRQNYENDDALHAPQRREAEAVRAELLAAKRTGANSDTLVAVLKKARTGAVTETTWQLRAAAPEPAQANPLEVKHRPNAQVLLGNTEQKLYFADLPGPLQQVLGAQLRRAGDVSAVIEMPGGFLVYVATEKTAEHLRVATLSIAKQTYEQWLQQQE